MPTTRDGHAAPALVVFTDLDGTLLRHEDYDWTAARGAVAELARRGIPLVIASSKTRAEIEAWRRRIGNHDPFISENGGALYVPPGVMPRPIPGVVPAAGRQRVEFGTPYAQLREALRLLACDLGVGLRGFGDMEAGEIAGLTGLAGEALELARQREYDEPFVSARPLTREEAVRLEELAGGRGLRVTRGGRFHHLTGFNSKGKVARLLMSAYRAGDEPVASVGAGDGPNDLELLRAVDHAVVVARPDGTHAPELRAGLPFARFTRGVGPVGFAEGVMEYLARFGG
jgi:mannosyl-3-phosphoglycerate phosphatase